jgi:hypothetical protein
MKKEFIKFAKMRNEKRWLIINEEKDDCFGEIYYYPRWRQYIVEYNPSGIIWNWKCSQKIVDFLKELNKVIVEGLK